MIWPLACPHPPQSHPLSPPLTSAMVGTAPLVWSTRRLHQLCISKCCTEAPLELSKITCCNLPARGKCRHIQCSCVSGLPDQSSNSMHCKRHNIFQNSLMSPASIGLSPSDCTSTSLDGGECAFDSACPALKAPEPNTSNHSTGVCHTAGPLSAAQAINDTSSACDSPDASVHGPCPCNAASPDSCREASPHSSREASPSPCKGASPTPCQECSPDPCKEACIRVKSPAAEVLGLQPLKKAPRGNSVKQYHGLDSLQGVVFYQMLEVTDEYGTKHCFDVRDKTQGALVSMPAVIAPHMLGHTLAASKDSMISTDSGAGVL